MTCAAQWRGLIPSLSVMPMSAPNSSIITRTVSVWLLAHAACSAVSP